MKKTKFLKMTISLFTFILFLNISPISASETDNTDITKDLYEVSEKVGIVADNDITATLTAEDGSKQDVVMYAVPSLRTFLDSKTLTETYVYKIDASELGGEIPTIKPFSSGTINDDDGTYVYGSLTATYTKLNASGGYQTRYLLTKVNGNWDIRTSQITLADRRVAYTCQSFAKPFQTAYKYPTSNSFTYNTGFSTYAEAITGSWVAAQMNCTVKRGTGKWTFDMVYSVYKNIPTYGDIFK